MIEFYEIYILDLSPRPLHRRGSLCSFHLSSVQRSSPVERGWGRGLEGKTNCLFPK